MAAGNGGFNQSIGEIILGELRAMKKDGCMRGATNTADLEHVKAGMSDHSRRIQCNEIAITELSTTVKTMPEAVSNKVIKKLNGNLKKAARTMIPIKAFGVECILPASWLGWALALAAIGYGLVAHMQGLSETKEQLHEMRKHIQVVAEPEEVAHNG